MALQENETGSFRTLSAFIKIRKGLSLIQLALKTIMTLSQLKAGEKGRIKGFESSDLELKLMEMGCIPGEVVMVEQIAPLGDPISIRIAGYSLSLRRNEANQILLED